MALKILQAGIQPLGQFDALDSQTTSCKGGEIASFTYVAIKDVGGTDKHATDVDDGYTSSSVKNRPAATTTLVSGMRPLFLVDDGQVGYGTLFGVVVGGTVGQTAYGPNSTVPSGSILGPHTAAGSGKWTLWDKPGLYAVTLDAVDTTAATGLVPSNLALLGGAPIYATAAGLLTPNVGSSFEAIVLGRFLEFTTSGSRVTSSLDQVSALNSGGGPALKPFSQVVFHYNPTV